MLALVSAMHEEIAAVRDGLSNVTTREWGGRRFHIGGFHGTEVVVVFSRYGKVAAAVTTTQLIAAFPVTALVFSGVAGAVAPGLAIGDIVVGTELIQHDMDASPLFPRYEIPLLGKSRFTPDPLLTDRLAGAAREFLARDLNDHVAAADREFFHIRAPKVTEGLIASGDKFFASRDEVHELRRRLPEVACVEMEGAAVAQVCDEYALPYAIVRTISDAADEQSVHDFPRFTHGIARQYSLGILTRMAGNPLIGPT